MINKDQRKIIISILLIFSLFVIISSTSAANITLTQSDVVTFKQNITNANSGSNIILDSNVNFNLDSSNVNITVNRNITIRSSSTSKNAVINLNNHGRAFTVANGVRLTLINITIINGKDDFYGGAIVNRGNIALTGCNFSNNKAPTGGAIYNVGNSVLTGCIFTSNTATQMGGAFVNRDNGTSTFTSCTFSGNIATNGGAILNRGTSVIANCIFSRNTATERVRIGDGGSAIYNYGSITTQGNTMVDNVGEDIVNYAGSSMTVLISSKLSIVTKFSNNRITITVTAMDENNKPISGKNIDFYVNGTKVATNQTNPNGTATYVHKVSRQGTYKIDAKISEFTSNINTTTRHTYLASSATRNTVLTAAKLGKLKVLTSKAVKKKGKKIFTKTYRYKNSGHITGSKTFTIKINKKYNLSGKITKSATISSAKHNKKTKIITVRVNKLAFNKIARVKFKIIQR